MWACGLSASTSPTTTGASHSPPGTEARRLQWRPPLLPASHPLISTPLSCLLILCFAAPASPVFAPAPQSMLFSRPGPFFFFAFVREICTNLQMIDYILFLLKLEDYYLIYVLAIV
jgi:hypothetical protein